MSIQELKQNMTIEEIDNNAIDQLAALMKTKMAKKRKQGFNGWTDSTPQDLSDLLRDHVDKGDPIDVANYCAFLIAHESGILAKKAPSHTNNYLAGYDLECPTCYLCFTFQPSIKPDGTGDCYLGAHSCIRCEAVMRIDYSKEFNMVEATLVESNQ